MAKINQPQPGPMWPWGGPRTVRERLVDRSQVDKAKKTGKAGNPKAPAMASAALLDSIGPSHNSEQLRLPLPPAPPGHDADVETFFDRPHLINVGRRAEEERKALLDRALSRLNAPADRVDRMKALLTREAQMINLCQSVGAEQKEILRLMWDAQKDEDI